MNDKRAERLVWDWPLRFWHWLFAVAVLGAGITGQWGGFDWRQWHFWFGQSAIGLLIFRVLWGFVGTYHARFASFIPRRSRLLAYLKTLARKDSAESPGHSPLGAVAVFVLLTAIALQAGTGLFMTDDILYEGPWYVAASDRVADLASSVHHRLARPIGALIVIHLAAILFYRLFKQQRLTRAMITGKKPADRVPESKAISGSRTVLALVLIVLVSALTWWLLAVAPPEPPAEMDFW